MSQRGKGDSVWMDFWGMALSVISKQVGAA
jgi:hypothetical protein